MCIRSVERQRVLYVGLRARRKVDVVETVSGITLVGDGDVFFDRYEMVLAEGIREAVTVELSDGY